MDENFTKLNKKQFVKMWRTMKAEVGTRRTSLEGIVDVDIKTIHELMDRYESRIVLDKVLNRPWWRKIL